MAIVSIALARMMAMTWIDVFEMICCTIVTYGVLSVLHKDKTGRLITTACCLYSGIFILWLAQCTTLLTMCYLCIPSALACLIMLHPTFIQRQYIGTRTHVHVAQSSEVWCDEIMKRVLTMMHHQRASIWFIECTDSLDTIIYAENRVQALISTSLIAMILRGTQESSDPLSLWVRVNGPLVGIQAHLHINEREYLGDIDDVLYTAWQRKALIATHATDAIIMCSHPLQRTCTIYVRGKIFEQLTPHHTVSFLKHHLTSLHKEYAWRNDASSGCSKAGGHASSGHSSLDIPGGS